LIALSITFDVLLNVKKAMKVTTGSAKGKRLKSVPGTSTRPITDRVKQALFNILMDEVRDTRWLDLFAGTGAVGIEALSRGATSCAFFDTTAAAVKVIEGNLRATGAADRAKVVRQDALRYLQGRPNTAYDFVYIAPPQYQGLWSKAMALLDAQPAWLGERGSIIVQIDPSEYTALALTHFELDDERRYGRSKLLFYSRPAA
jgi:16S rRNA (guanine966-N2)-methyltransferase